MQEFLELERDSAVSWLSEAQEGYESEVARFNSKLLIREKELESWRGVICFAEKFSRSIAADGGDNGGEARLRQGPWYSAG